MKFYGLLFIVILSFLPVNESTSFAGENYLDTSSEVENSADFARQTVKSLYDRFPAGAFSREAFEQALTGLAQLKDKAHLKRAHILTLIDFSKPSTQQRLFVIDLLHGKILHSSLVAHGRNSGENMAVSFSNTPESYRSSLGFYVTAETYQGKHGYSLRLDGQEKGINDKARDRAIVIHGADYVSEAFASAHGRLGRSQGCPALPRDATEQIINTIKGGSLLYIYAPSKEYLSMSALLKNSDPDCMLDALAMLREG